MSTCTSGRSRWAWHDGSGTWAHACWRGACRSAPLFFLGVFAAVAAWRCPLLPAACLRMLCAALTAHAAVHLPACCASLPQRDDVLDWPREFPKQVCT